MSVLDRLLNPIGREIQLPSNGVFGGPKTVTVRGFVTKDDKDILLIDEKLPTIQLRQVVSNLVINPTDFNIDKCVAADITAILLAARIATFGDEIELNTVCSDCGHSEIKTLSLGSLSGQFLSAAPAGIKLELPSAQIEIIYHVLSIGEQKTIEQNLRNAQKLFNQNIDVELLNSAYTAGMIDLINDGGVVVTMNPIDKQLLVENMSKHDIDVWNQDRAQYDCGYKFNTQFKCSKCKSTAEHTLIIGYDFFYKPMRQVLTTNIVIF